jgi:hypothetical protein
MLWDGIAASLPGGAVFTGYSDEQCAWEHNLIWGSNPTSVWVASRGFSKTWTSIDAYIKKMLLFPRTWVIWIPGGSIEQTEQARFYFNSYFDTSDALDKFKGIKWQETYKQFKNGSFIKFTSATKRGVQSKRASVVHCDEAQLLESNIYMLAKFQATKAGAQFNLTGTAAADTLFHQAFLDPKMPFKMMTPIHLAVAAGIIDKQVVIDLMNDPRMTMADKLEQAWCIWQRLSDRAFAPKIIHEMPNDDLINWSTACWGWDFNPSKGHWGVKSVRLYGGRILSFKEQMVRTYYSILDISDSKIIPENGGTNAGYCDALLHENETHKPRRSIITDIWTTKSKSDQVAEMIRLQEHDQWLIYEPGCPVLAADAPRTPFDLDGMPDKIKMNELGMNPHVVDADIHSVNGCNVVDNKFEMPSGGDLYTM